MPTAAPAGGADLRSSATPAARFDVGGNTLTLDGTAAGTRPEDFRAASDEDLYDFREYTSALVPSERSNVYASAQLDLNEHTAAIAQLGFADNESEATLAPTPVFTAFESLPLTVSATNAYNPFGTDITDLRRRFVELGAREQLNRSQTARTVLGLEGLGGGNWEWDATLALEPHRERGDPRAPDRRRPAAAWHRPRRGLSRPTPAACR
jgi:iron complex outermembrane receptor protein